MAFEDLNKIKELAIQAMFSDDDLMDRLVLKGGNALDLVYKITPRASIDIDLSIEDEFPKDDLPAIHAKIESSLKKTFLTAGFQVFDVKFDERPKVPSSNKPSIWGGYQVEFKVIRSEQFQRLAGNHEALRRNATVVGPAQQKTFNIDISKYEYCEGKQEKDFGGYTIYVYSPKMLVFEKIRAICQQMPEYAKIIPNVTQSARAKDFFDIYILLESFHIDFLDQSNLDLLRLIFDAKKVPLSFMGKIKNYREYHRAGFDAVRDTVGPKTKLKDFDFYFDFVIERCKVLESLWEK